MAWNDLASNECPTKADINARFKEYLNWQSRSITFDNSDYTVNPGGAPWNYLFIWIENTISEWNNRTPYIPIPVSTQFRASPFERALFSALNRVLLIN